MTSLAATDLACRRGERLLFRGLSFALAPGDGVHVLGANGVGKSSLLRILAGLLRPLAGTVDCHGAVALLDERAAFDSALPLGKALSFWALLDGGEAALEALGLAPLADVPVRFLSTGQRKRAMMARVIAQAAPIWLLDEPLAGLDTGAQARIDALVTAHREGGGIVIAASHQPFATPLRTLDLTEYTA